MSRWRQIGLLAGNDLRLILRDRASLGWMLLLPLALMWIFGSMNGGDPRQASLAVDDRDGGWLARTLVKELSAGERLELTELAERTDRQVGPGAGSPATAGTAGAAGGGGRRRQAPAPRPPIRTLVIPAGFTANALAGRRQTLRLEQASGANEEFSLAAEAHVVRAIVRVVGRLAEAGPPPPGDSQGAATRRFFAAVAARPPLVTVAVTTAGGGHPVPRGFAQSVPGILTMTVLMMTLIYGAVFLTLEKQNGLIRRQAALPLSRAVLFAGKLAGRVLLAAVQAVLLLLAGRLLFGLSLGSSPAGLALLLGAYLLAVAALSTFLGAVLSSPEQASAVGWTSSMVLAALGGCWWPSEVMPRWLWSAAHVLPTPWAMDGFHALISFGHGVEAVLLPAAVLLGFAALFAALGSALLRSA
ncbi:MAG TPA: ABC transporter permease [Thermoanaerobaculia bacterium]